MAMERSERTRGTQRVTSEDYRMKPNKGPIIRQEFYTRLNPDPEAPLPQRSVDLQTLNSEELIARMIEDKSATVRHAFNTRVAAAFNAEATSQQLSADCTTRALRFGGTTVFLYNPRVAPSAVTVSESSDAVSPAAKPKVDGVRSSRRLRKYFNQLRDATEDEVPALIRDNPSVNKTDATDLFIAPFLDAWPASTATNSTAFDPDLVRLACEKVRMERGKGCGDKGALNYLSRRLGVSTRTLRKLVESSRGKS